MFLVFFASYWLSSFDSYYIQLTPLPPQVTPDSRLAAVNAKKRISSQISTLSTTKDDTEDSRDSKKQKRYSIDKIVSHQYKDGVMFLEIKWKRYAKTTLEEVTFIAKQNVELSRMVNTYLYYQGLPLWNQIVLPGPAPVVAPAPPVVPQPAKQPVQQDSDRPPVSAQPAQDSLTSPRPSFVPASSVPLRGWAQSSAKAIRASNAWAVRSKSSAASGGAAALARSSSVVPVPVPVSPPESPSAIPSKHLTAAAKFLDSDHETSDHEDGRGTPASEDFLRCKEEFAVVMREARMEVEAEEAARGGHYGDMAVRYSSPDLVTPDGLMDRLLWGSENEAIKRGVPRSRRLEMDDESQVLGEGGAAVGHGGMGGAAAGEDRIGGAGGEGGAAAGEGGVGAGDETTRVIPVSSQPAYASCEENVLVPQTPPHYLPETPQPVPSPRRERRYTPETPRPVRSTEVEPSVTTEDVPVLQRSEQGIDHLTPVVKAQDAQASKAEKSDNTKSDTAKPKSDRGSLMGFRARVTSFLSKPSSWMVAGKETSSAPPSPRGASDDKRECCESTIEAAIYYNDKMPLVLEELGFRRMESGISSAAGGMGGAGASKGGAGASKADDKGPTSMDLDDECVTPKPSSSKPSSSKGNIITSSEIPYPFLQYPSYDIANANWNSLSSMRWRPASFVVGSDGFVMEKVTDISETRDISTVYIKIRQNKVWGARIHRLFPEGTKVSVIRDGIDIIYKVEDSLRRWG